ncbi:MAG TPA: helix-turn-helix transcriptional regulator [Candidatus Hungatella pullicola]|nr:helix-turn-helix transcriptional regulator [Candidatus Hungatella pullicola]
MYYDPVECGMRIAKLRLELGQTQQQMADKLNISLDHYRALETGRRGGSLDLLTEIAITFDISLDYLILGRMKYSDSQRIQRELENITNQINQLKASL